MSINKTLEKFVSKFTDLMSMPISFVIVVLITILAIVFQLDSTIVNLCISVFTMIVGQSVLVSTRRGEIALHLKLDEIIEANEDMTNEAVGAEHETTEKLEEIKKEVEQRC